MQTEEHAHIESFGKFFDQQLQKYLEVVCAVI